MLIRITCQPITKCQALALKADAQPHNGALAFEMPAKGWAPQSRLILRLSPTAFYSAARSRFTSIGRPCLEALPACVPWLLRRLVRLIHGTTAIASISIFAFSKASRLTATKTLAGPSFGKYLARTGRIAVVSSMFVR